MTFSIVARDPQTGAMGVATATGGPVVGSLVPHARAGVGAIATQSLTNPHFGFDGLDMLADETLGAQQVLDRLLADDPGRDERQCLVLDRRGNTAIWTGTECAAVAGGRVRDNLAVAGNFLSGTEVLEDMIAAFNKASGAIEDRLLAALAAGDFRGGDRRGIRSAALKVYDRQPFPAVDLRSDWSTVPLDDLRRILAATREPEYAGFFKSVPTR